jgi:hypothetical protein
VVVMQHAVDQFDVVGDELRACGVTCGHAFDEVPQQRELTAEHGVHHVHLADVGGLLIDGRHARDTSAVPERSPGLPSRHVSPGGIPRDRLLSVRRSSLIPGA